MKFVSWNVNGLRACMGKGFLDRLNEQNADFFCIQESKMHKGQAVVETPGFAQHWNSAIKKGYSGTVTFVSEALQPITVTNDFPGQSGEGRTITVEMPGFYLINSYTPNAQPELARIDYRMKYEDDLRAYMQELDKKKPVILCGDLNVAHNEIDLKNPGPNRGNPGFSDEERGKMTELLSAGFVDSFRYLYPDVKDAYSWWSFRANARARNVGWRIDYFVVSERLAGCIKEAGILPEIMGSDHCPVFLELDDEKLQALV
ncbi:MAG: exodeoxyribonuclease III [Christensenellaceae bacterium]|nr:exodeoxyribonuclease III [Christensenellaceae bacterium]